MALLITTRLAAEDIIPLTCERSSARHIGPTVHASGQLLEGRPRRGVVRIFPSPALPRVEATEAVGAESTGGGTFADGAEQPPDNEEGQNDEDDS
jgi:hypothetical protein